jgi:hypothetical protein
MIRTNPNSETEHNCIIVVSSCDAYSDAWSPFLQLFDRYWANCPWQTWWITNQKNVAHPRVRTFAVGEDLAWASNLLKLLDDQQPDSVIYLQEDYFLQNQVDSDRLQRVIDFARSNDVGYIRLAGSPDPDLTHQNPFGLGELSRGLKFRCSLQAAWWDVATLRNLLVAGENGWQMEMAGSRRSDALPETFLGVYRDQPLIDYYYDTGILKGKWMPGALDLLRREGIRVDTSHRATHARLPLFLKKVRLSRPVAAVRDLFRTHSSPN